jgi:hypothetical protein
VSVGNLTLPQLKVVSAHRDTIDHASGLVDLLVRRIVDLNTYCDTMRIDSSHVLQPADPFLQLSRGGGELHGPMRGEIDLISICCDHDRIFGKTWKNKARVHITETEYRESGIASKGAVFRCLSVTPMLG